MISISAFAHLQEFRSLHLRRIRVRLSLISLLTTVLASSANAGSAHLVARLSRLLIRSAESGELTEVGQRFLNLQDPLTSRWTRELLLRPATQASDVRQFLDALERRVTDDRILVLTEAALWMQESGNSAARVVPARYRELSLAQREDLQFDRFLRNQQSGHSPSFWLDQIRSRLQEGPVNLFRSATGGRPSLSRRVSTEQRLTPQEREQLQLSTIFGSPSREAGTHSTNMDELRIEQISAAIQSPEAALVVYQQLGEIPRADIRTRLLTHLLERHPQFQDTLPVADSPNTLITYSFEKETRRAEEISILFRDPSIPEDRWFALAPPERTRRLQACAQNRWKEFLPPEVVAPTSLHPNYLSGYSQESLPGSATPIFEVASQSFEISPSRLFSQMNDLALFLGGETSSFHVHLVFELPLQTRHFGEFRVWLKALNDRVYLLGLEEGLQATEMAQIPRLSSRQTWGAGILERLRSLAGSRTLELPHSLMEVGRRSSKFFGVGLRGDIYGQSLNEGLKRIGLEFRDTTRNLNKLKAVIENTAEDVSLRLWESGPGSRSLASEGNVWALHPAQPTETRPLVALGISEGIASRILRSEPMALTPLNPLESATYFDYHMQTFRRPPEEIRERLASARLIYAQSMRDLAAELTRYQHQGTAVLNEEISLAVQMSLSEWAKQVRFSELFWPRHSSQVRAPSGT
jgi:hypothetical protein